MGKNEQRSTRERLLESLNHHLREHPNTPVSFERLGKELGVHSVRIAKLYKELWVYYDLPLVQTKMEQVSRKGSTQRRLLMRLQRHLRDRPSAPISLTQLGYELGVTKERIRALYNKLKVHYQLPPIQPRGSKMGMTAERKQRQERIDADLRLKVQTMRSQGMSRAQIIEELSSTDGKIKRIISQLISRGETTTRASRHLERKQEIKRLRLAGLSYPKIARQIGIGEYQVGRIVRNLTIAGEIDVQTQRQKKLIA